MINKLLNFKKNQICPFVNGITFNDASIQLFDIKIDWTPSLKFNIQMKQRSSIELLQKNGTLRWVDCIILDKKRDEHLSIEAFCGESTYGTDGFIAVIELETEKLKWIAFFDCSNPFDQIKIEGDFIYATSTYNCQWKFDLYNPTSIWITCL